MLRPFDKGLFGKVIEAVDGESSENVVAEKLMNAVSNIIDYDLTKTKGKNNVPRMFAGVTKAQFKAAYAGTEEALVNGE